MDRMLGFVPWTAGRGGLLDVATTVPAKRSSATGRTHGWGWRRPSSSSPRCWRVGTTVVQCSATDGSSEEVEKAAAAAAEAVVTEDGRGTRIRRGLCLGGLAALVVYSFALAPGTTETTSELIQQLISNPLSDSVNGIYELIFNGMPIWSAVYAATLLPGARKGQRLPLAAFLGASLAVGSFAILPYLAFREYRPSPDPAFPKSRGAFLELRWVAVGLTLGALVLFGNAMGLADERRDILDYIFAARWVDYTLLFSRDKLVSTNSVDFLFLWIFFVDPLVEDMRRRRMYKGKPEDIFLVSTIMAAPLLGPCVYLLFRPLAETFTPSLDDGNAATSTAVTTDGSSSADGGSVSSKSASSSSPDAQDAQI